MNVKNISRMLGINMFPHIKNKAIRVYIMGGCSLLSGDVIRGDIIFLFLWSHLAGIF